MNPHLLRLVFLSVEEDDSIAVRMRRRSLQVGLIAATYKLVCKPVAELTFSGTVSTAAAVLADAGGSAATQSTEA